MRFKAAVLCNNARFTRVDRDIDLARNVERATHVDSKGIHSIFFSPSMSAPAVMLVPSCRRVTHIMDRFRD